MLEFLNISFVRNVLTYMQIYPVLVKQNSSLVYFFHMYKNYIILPSWSEIDCILSPSFLFLFLGTFTDMYSYVQTGTFTSSGEMSFCIPFNKQESWLYRPSGKIFQLQSRGFMFESQLSPLFKLEYQVYF